MSGLEVFEQRGYFRDALVLGISKAVLQPQNSPGEEEPMKWDWGRPYGARPGQRRRFGIAITLGWFVAGVSSLLMGGIGRTNVALPVLGTAMIFLAAVGVAMGAGVIP